jgi:hypothetical protein
MVVVADGERVEMEKWMGMGKVVVEMVEEGLEEMGREVKVKGEVG